MNPLDALIALAARNAGQNPVDQIIWLTSMTAQKLRLQHVIVAARDQQTGAARVVASPGAVEAMRNDIAAKFGFGDDDLGGADAEWPV
jgi:hypothetical protein